MKKLVILLIISTMLLSLVATGCKSTTEKKDTNSGTASTNDTKDNDDVSNKNADVNEPVRRNEFPFADEKINLKMVRLNWPDVRPNAGETWTWKKFSELSNIEVEWDELAITSYEEALNIKLATGDLPDAFYQMIFTHDQIVNQAEAGALIPLNDLIEKYAPNIKKMLEDDPSIRKAITMPDGNIYSLPFVVADGENKNSALVRFYINEDYLNRLGLKSPKTIDELTNVLVAFKEQDANGDGDATDEVPIYVPGSILPNLFNQFYGAYGIGNRGIQGNAIYIDMGDDGKVRFIPTSENYKQMLQQMNEWWELGLWHPETFNEMEASKWQAAGSENQVGLFGWVHPNYVGEEAQNNFRGITQFEGPNGDSILSWVDASVRGIWSFLITSKNEHPIETIKWADYWYSEEGYMFSKVGLEGETYALEGDKYKFIGDVEASIEELGEQVGAFQHLERWYGGFEPQIDGMALSDENKKIMDDLTVTKTAEEIFRIDPTDYLNYMPEEIWGVFPPTAEEAIELGPVFNDIKTYVEETRALFVTGKLNFEDDWDKYVSTLKEMGGDRYLEIKQQQYDRYSK